MSHTSAAYVPIPATLPPLEKRVFGLDLLRAVAISLVVICHVILLFPLRERVGVENANVLGFLGVELFFVLSGFLIGQILLRDLSRSPSFQTLKHFLIRRWFRTLPNYLLFLAISAFGVGYLSSDRDYGWKYLFFLQNMTTPMTPFFTVSWSLSIEEWFYILYGIVALTFARILRPFKLSMTLCVVTFILLFTALRWSYVAGENPSWDDGVRKITLYRLDAIAYGVAAALYKFTLPSSWNSYRKQFLFLAVVLFIFSIVIYFSIDLDHSLLARVFLFPLVSSSVALMLPILDSWKASQGVLADSVTRLSIWSYSLYLSHGILVDKLSIRRDILLQLDRTSMTVTIIGFLAIAVGSAALVYRFFERPMTSLRDRWR